MISPPLPPPELAAYILGDAKLPEARALEAYEEQGRAIRDGIIALLGDDWSFEGRRVLDFGCGAGRVLRQFLDLADTAELCGCDIDPACVAWLEDHLSPPVQVVLSHESPPLPWADGHFDLIYAISVFSHLADTWSAWLVELHRLLAPGGLFVATVMGSAFSEEIAGEPWEEERVGMNVLGSGRPWAAGGPMILHSEWWLRAHWGRAFEVLAFRPEAILWQDGILLRRRNIADLSAATLELPEPGEERELIAARHAIRQLHREHARLNSSHDAYAEAYRQETERNEEASARVRELEAKLLDAQAQLAAVQAERTGLGRWVDRVARTLG